MPNNLCLFPNSKQSQAETYAAAVNAHYSANYEPGGAAASVRLDLYGNWVVAHYAPPFDPLGDGMFVEPPELEALRVDAAIAYDTRYPEDEDV